MRRTAFLTLHTPNLERSGEATLSAPLLVPLSSLSLVGSRTIVGVEGCLLSGFCRCEIGASKQSFTSPQCQQDPSGSDIICPFSQRLYLLCVCTIHSAASFSFAAPGCYDTTAAATTTTTKNNRIAICTLIYLSGKEDSMIYAIYVSQN